MEDESPSKTWAEHMLSDSAERLKFQHEFSLAGFRTLVLINGGAIIGLLTYAGNVLDKQAAQQLGSAFICYVVGLTATTAAYVAAYFSQAMGMNASAHQALLGLGLSQNPEKDGGSAETATTWGHGWIVIAICLVALGLVGFVVGSVLAMRALT